MIPEPLVARLPRQVGYKEVRYAHLLSGEPVAISAPAPVVQAPYARESRDDSVARLQGSVDRLEAEVADLILESGQHSALSTQHSANVEHRGMAKC